ncbi:SNF2 family N-terminal domain-containing protein [Xylaria bambusicola]|uniref:SNF2 family N-terminal domain-containing protein n=1 Tax=Xylaria bambusicola TaxID=326684 RepID=UPI002008795D|nr:SNF2 family N-terminal domain-containing protein [Xylaria bambusicola]KAI0521262.1 SNF2 family N-terminal domain-containing protein [Xylaria bambusicola]
MFQGYRKRAASSGRGRTQWVSKRARPGNDPGFNSSQPPATPRSLSSSVPSHRNPPSSQGSSTQLHLGATSEEPITIDDDDESGVPTEPPPLEFYGSMEQKIVGVRYYNGIVTPGESILCRRERENQYDSNAVRVDDVMGGQIGHLPRNLVQKLAPYLDRGDIVLEGILTGQKTPFDCPIRLYLYGTSNTTARLELEAKLKADKLLKATQLKNTRQEAEAQRAIANESKGDESASALGLGSSDFSQSQPALLEESEAVDFRADPSALDVLNMDEAALSAMPQAPQPDAIKSTLLFHQLQGLAWMRAKENPQLPAPDSTDVVQLWKRTNGGNFQNLASGHVTNARPRLLSGGILTDDMGLGKTLQTISLVMSEGFEEGPTLIVAPTGVLSNWEQQFKEHVKEDRVPRVLRCHGSSKYHQLNKSDLLQYDVVITSYGLLASQFKSANWTALFGLTWRRVVLDEGHVIRNPNTKSAQAACKLQAKSRWILSGTPFVNNTTDFWSALLFLKISGGIQEKSIFNSRIARPLEGIVKDKNNTVRLKIRGEAQALFQALVQDLCLRRKKDMAFINLRMPEKSEYVHRVRFTKLEQLRYEEILGEAREVLQQFVARSYDKKAKKRKRDRDTDGGKEVKFANVLETLLRLRQMCDHWSLTGSRVKDILAKLGEDSLVALTPENIQILIDALAEAIRIGEDCPICYDPIQTHDPVITACKHRFGRTCILDALKRQERCPMCRQELTGDGLLGPRPLDAEIPTGADVDSDRRSSKTDQLEALVEKHLQDPESKVVIFSQWTSFLDIIETLLVEKKVECARLEGKMNIKQRDEAVSRLNNDPETRVMLASLHAAGVGVNLTAADTVILTDCWWAPAIEDQAVDRIHRIGQKRPVTVYKLLVEGSVEYRVLDIQSDKRKLVALAFQDEDYIRKEEGAVSDIRHLLYG